MYPPARNKCETYQMRQRIFFYFLRFLEDRWRHVSVGEVRGRSHPYQLEKEGFSVLIPGGSSALLAKNETRQQGSTPDSMSAAVTTQSACAVEAPAKDHSLNAVAPGGTSTLAAVPQTFPTQTPTKAAFPPAMPASNLVATLPSSLLAPAGSSSAPPKMGSSIPPTPTPTDHQQKVTSASGGQIPNAPQTHSSKRKRTPSWRVLQQEQDAQEAKLQLLFGTIHVPRVRSFPPLSLSPPLLLRSLSLPLFCLL